MVSQHRFSATYKILQLKWNDKSSNIKTITSFYCSYWF